MSPKEKKSSLNQRIKESFIASEKEFGIVTDYMKEVHPLGKFFSTQHVPLSLNIYIQDILQVDWNKWEKSPDLVLQFAQVLQHTLILKVVVLYAFQEGLLLR